MRRIFLVPLLAALGLSLPSAPKAQDAESMTVHFINVGQGDATLLEFACGAILVDAGGEGEESWPAGITAVGYLSGFFEGRRDLGYTLGGMVLTHQHIDHIFGAPRVVDEFTVDRIVDNGRRAKGVARKPYKKLVDLLWRFDREDTWTKVGMDSIDKKGRVLDELDPAFAGCTTKPVFTALWGGLAEAPAGWGRDRYGDHPIEDESNHSLVLRVDYGDASILFTGGLERSALKSLVARYGKGASGLLGVDIVQVGNHGASDGITEGLLKAMSPEVAVLSMGAAWRHGEWTAADHGHPRRDVVELLAKGVSGKRPVTTVRVFEGEDTPYDKVALKKAVYGTGWDRTVVMDVTPKGDVSVVWPGK